MAVVNDKLRRKDIEYSKKIVKYSGIFTGAQVAATMALICIFPIPAGNLVTICMTVIAGCMTIFSWYFAKAYGENKIKITNGVQRQFSSVVQTSSGETVETLSESDG